MKIDEKLKAAFQFKDYLFEELSFRMNKEELKFNQSKTYKLSTQLSVETGTDEDSKNNGWVILDCNIKGEDSLAIHAKMKGFFELKNSSENMDFAAFLRVNGTAIMFPYLRAAISDLTRMGNIPPIILPLINTTKITQDE